jgi:hypothetical protein
MSRQRREQNGPYAGTNRLFCTSAFDLCGVTHREVRPGARKSLGRRFPDFCPDGFEVVGDIDGRFRLAPLT